MIALFCLLCYHPSMLLRKGGVWGHADGVALPCRICAASCFPRSGADGWTKVNQPERDALVLLIRSGGGNHRLLLSANANQARAQLTAQAYENPAEPPMFCMLMRKHLLGARVKDVGQVAGDRILTIAFDCLDELGDSVEKRSIWR